MPIDTCPPPPAEPAARFVLVGDAGKARAGDPVIAAAAACAGHPSHVVTSNHDWYGGRAGLALEGEAVEARGGHWLGVRERLANGLATQVAAAPPGFVVVDAGPVVTLVAVGR